MSERHCSTRGWPFIYLSLSCISFPHLQPRCTWSGHVNLHSGIGTITSGQLGSLHWSSASLNAKSILAWYRARHTHHSHFFLPVLMKYLNDYCLENRLRQIALTTIPCLMNSRTVKIPSWFNIHKSDLQKVRFHPWVYKRNSCDYLWVTQMNPMTHREIWR